MMSYSRRTALRKMSKRTCPQFFPNYGTSSSTQLEQELASLTYDVCPQLETALTDLMDGQTSEEHKLSNEDLKVLTSLKDTTPDPDKKSTPGSFKALAEERAYSYAQRILTDKLQSLANALTSSTTPEKQEVYLTILCKLTQILGNYIRKETNSRRASPVNT